MGHGDKITFGEMRDAGVRGILIYCADFKRSHHVALPADHSPDDVRLSDLESPCPPGLRQTGRRCPARFCAGEDGLSLMPW